MRTLTIKEAMEGGQDLSDHYLYLYRDGETIFYVGQSVQPLTRLHQHFGFDAVGMLIQDHLPASLAWTMELYTLQDCQEIVARCRPVLLPYFQRCLASGPYDRDAVNVAEESLIEYHRPCLNVIGVVSPNPLPDRYVKCKIANEGVRLRPKG